MSENIPDKAATELRRDNLQQLADRANNEAFAVSRRKRFLEFILLVTGGLVMSMAFPPLNWTWLAWIGMVPLYFLVMNKTPWAAFRAGLVWGYALNAAAFFWLREIEYILPFVMAFVLGLFPAFWAALVPILKRQLLIPAQIQLKGYEEEERYCPLCRRNELLLAAGLAGWWVILEWIRSWIATGLPWNFLAATQWRNIPLIQICEYTGVYGVSFLIALVNLTFAVTITAGHGGNTNLKRPLPYPLLFAIALTGGVIWFGTNTAVSHATVSGETISFSAALIQGDISQRRHASQAQADEAVSKYLELSEKAAKMSPALIIWPETATPYPLRAASPQCSQFYYQLRSMILRHQIPYMVGSIDFEILPPGVKRSQGITNSALLFNADARLIDKFDKEHIVPFGEFIPFRCYLPEFVIRVIDMGRDLTRGTRFNPLPIHPGVYAGISICFEDVFPYVSRNEALNGANLLAVITNDAWYPVSSEPEQHLANSIFRAVETRLPMIRCGNNSASCLIAPNGKITDSIFKRPGKNGDEPDIIRRGEGIGLFKVTVAAQPQMTFYTRYGDIFILGCFVLTGLAVLLALGNWRRKKLLLLQTITPESNSPRQG